MPKKKKKDNTSSSYFVGSLVQQHSYIKILKFMKISLRVHKINMKIDKNKHA